MTFALAGGSILGSISRLGCGILYDFVGFKPLGFVICFIMIAVNLSFYYAATIPGLYATLIALLPIQGGFFVILYA